MITTFICEMADKHAIDEERYPDLALYCPYWYSGVYVTPDILTLASEVWIDPAAQDDMMTNALDGYFIDPNVKITSFVSPTPVPVVGQTFGQTLFIATLEGGDVLAACVTTERETARHWLTEYDAQPLGPTQGKPDRNAPAGKYLLHVGPLPLSPNLHMTLSLAALTSQSA
ncbi:hypothetical protein [Acetobacter malorum]|nr:hypothetical protein [Acetobacter malorum]